MKRFLAIFCSFLMMFTSFSVFADSPETTEISESGTVEIEFGVEVPSNWKVTLPAKVSLIKQEDDTYKGTFEKVVNGDLSSDKQIRVRPSSNSVVISDANGEKSDITGTLTDNNTNFLYTDLSETGRECYVTSPILTAGTWEGTVSYNIDIVGSDYQDPGFYLEDGTLLRALSVEEVNNYGALSSHTSTSLPKYLGLTNAEIKTITKIVMPEMEAPSNCSNMFYDCEYIEDIVFTGFDTSNVTNMKSMFSYAGSRAKTFNLGDLSGWNTSNVTNMSSMFYNATTAVNLDLSNWDVSNVTNMDGMFYEAAFGATTFNIGDLSGWNTSKVINMRQMFYKTGYLATTFNIGDLSNWNTENVTDMNNMFCLAGRNATTWNIGDLSEWNTSNVTNMGHMFDYAGYSATTWSIGDISSWDTSNVTDMSNMFDSAGYSATYSLNLSKWKVSKVTSHDNFNANVVTKVISPIYWPYF